MKRQSEGQMRIDWKEETFSYQAGPECQSENFNTIRY